MEILGVCDLTSVLIVFNMALGFIVVQSFIGHMFAKITEMLLCYYEKLIGLYHRQTSITVCIIE